jgi:hypothetical protein
VLTPGPDPIIHILAATGLEYGVRTILQKLNSSGAHQTISEK